MDEIEVMPGCKVVQRIGYEIPPNYHAISGVYPTGRKWWQFWLPRVLYHYAVVEKQPETKNAER